MLEVAFLFFSMVSILLVYVCQFAALQQLLKSLVPERKSIEQGFVFFL